MLRKRRDSASLQDMLRMAEEIAEEMRDISLEQYRSDQNLRYAIERRLEILGEAANRLSPEFRASHPQIPWRRIIGQRNFLIHEYDEVKIERVWGLTIQEVPRVLAELQAIADEIGIGH